jgi:S-DNA-T family DNA segregation ATPase FtsK/SpoIIIE
VSQIIVKRPPRVLPSEVPTEEIQLQPPPALPKGQQEGALMQILPMLGMGGSVVFYFVNGQPFMKVMGAVMLASSVAMAIAMIVRFRRGAQGELATMRRDYLLHLTDARNTVRRTARAQRDAQYYLHPSPEQLWALVAEGSRVWERRPGDDDFAQVRIGLGPQSLAAPLVPPQTSPVEQLEPLTTSAMQRFVALHSTLDALPMAVSLRAFYHVTVSGDPECARGTARALVASLASLHSPEDLVIAVAAGRDALAHWDWAKWLPHVQDKSGVDGAGSRRLIVGDPMELEELLSARLQGRPRFHPEGAPLPEEPHIVVVLDSVSLLPVSTLASSQGLQGVTVVEVVPGELAGPRDGLSVVVHPQAVHLVSEDGFVYEGTPDLLSYPAAEALARQLAPLRVASGGEDDEPLLANLEFTDLLGLGDAASVDTKRTWRPRALAERLRVPIGLGEDGRPVMLDLKEAAQEGMGPHGLCVGATGSGKSELLRTLVLGLP